MMRAQKDLLTMKVLKKASWRKKKQMHDLKFADNTTIIQISTVCRKKTPDPNTFKQYLESKHLKTPLPPELTEV
uniref:Uncharacterized protein n=1 Tax=Urocitellus parryii TaxID=9999 RepID=A0A8D2HSR2_UROPR